MNKIKILQINKMYYPVTGGVERVVQQIAEGLNSQTDMKVLVCQPQGQGAVEQINGVEVHKAGSLGRFFSMPFSWAFFRQYKNLTADRDIIHIHMPFPLADLAVFCYGFKGKVVLWWHSDIVKQKKLLRLYQPLLIRLLQRADLIMAATAGLIAGSDYLTPYRDKCVVIPFGVSHLLLEKSEAYLNSKISKSTTAPLRILFAGRLVYYKGCDVLLRALARVQGAELDLVGSGPLEPTLRELVQALQLSDRVHFRGALNDEALAEALAECDFLVLPSIAKSEAFALVQIEAMAYSKPVINTNLPSGVPEVSLDGVTGLTVPPGDVDALAEAMQKLIDDPDLRERFGQAAYKRVREEYMPDQMLDRIYEEYQKLMEQKAYGGR